MSERTFQICGASVPPLIGRSAIMRRLRAGAGKELPNHMSLVGPRFGGKTVILHALARELRAPNSGYTAVVLWDLGHLTPGTDEEFMRALCAQFIDALASCRPALAGYLRDVHENPYQELLEVLSELQREGGRPHCCVMVSIGRFPTSGCREISGINFVRWLRSPVSASSPPAGSACCSC